MAPVARNADSLACFTSFQWRLSWYKGWLSNEPDCRGIVYAARRLLAAIRKEESDDEEEMSFMSPELDAGYVGRMDAATYIHTQFSHMWQEMQVRGN